MAHQPMELDHLVVAARTLDEGVAWCEATLGHLPAAGGEHPLMGTHNRVFSIACDAFPRAYLEIIAINPLAPLPARKRWFDLDDPEMARLLTGEPRLIHWAARCNDMHAAMQAMSIAGIDRGEVLQAERNTPSGVLRWQISVRADGQRLFGGALPTLIQWGDVHPTDAMAASGIALKSAAVMGLAPALAQQLPRSVSAFDHAGEPQLRVELSTPLGDVTLATFNTGAHLVRP